MFLFPHYTFFSPGNLITPPITIARDLAGNVVGTYSHQSDGDTVAMLQLFLSDVLSMPPEAISVFCNDALNSDSEDDMSFNGALGAGSALPEGDVSIIVLIVHSALALRYRKVMSVSSKRGY